MVPSISRVIRRGAFAPGISTPPITRSASGSASSMACRLDICRSTVRPRLTSSSRMRSTLRSKMVTSALHALRDQRSVVADDAAAQHQHLGRQHARHATHQPAAAAERLHQVVGADLGGQPSRHLAHRRQQRQPLVGRLHRLVGDRGGAALDQAARQLGRRRQVQVGEQHLAGRELLVLAVQRLLHLQHHLRLAPDRVDVGDRGAGGDVVVVRDGAALAGAGLDHDLMAAVDQLARAGVGQRDAVLVLLDLLGYADLHLDIPLLDGGNSAARRSHGCGRSNPEIVRPHPPLWARSISAAVTAVMPSRSATAMCSADVWISAAPLHRFRQGMPAALKTLASAPPPDSMKPGS